MLRIARPRPKAGVPRPQVSEPSRTGDRQWEAAEPDPSKCIPVDRLTEEFHLPNVRLCPRQRWRQVASTHATKSRCRNRRPRCALGGVRSRLRLIARQWQIEKTRQNKCYKTLNC